MLDNNLPLGLTLDNIAWSPIPDTSQEVVMRMEGIHHLLLTGGRGWGKTELQLMRFARLVGKGYGTYWRGIIFDREYKNLDDLVVKSKRILKDVYGDSARFLSSNSDYKWVWDTGEELLFRQAKTDNDYWSYHGHEYPFIGWNELTKYPNIKLYHKMMSINRSGFDPDKHTPKRLGHNGGPPLDDIKVYDTIDGLPLPKIPLEVVSTTNPYGVGHNWVKTEFIDAAPYGKVVNKSIEIYNPRTKQNETIVRKQVTLFGSFRQNPYLSPEYIAGLFEETDENIIKAWIYGDWNIVAGGAFDDVWKPHIHVIPRFKIPASWGWFIDRSMDWGSTHPASIGWWAEANGEEVELPDGTTICPKPGTLIQIAEIYLTKKVGTNIGLKLGATAVAEQIVAVEKQLIEQGWIEDLPSPGPADNEISAVRESTTDTIEKKMNDAGIYWEKSDKSSGSRKMGLQLMRDRLEASITNEGPGLLFMDNCRASISTIPVLPRDENNLDDVDTDAEDHPYDMVRYRVLKGNNRMAKVIHVTFSR